MKFQNFTYMEISRKLYVYVGERVPLRGTLGRNITRNALRALLVILLILYIKNLYSEKVSFFFTTSIWGGR